MMEIHNYMEEAVKEVLDGILSQREDVCKCDVCRSDMMAWALNRLPSKYVATQKGRVYTKLDEINIQFKTDIIKEVVRAVEYVKDKPRH